LRLAVTARLVRGSEEAAVSRGTTLAELMERAGTAVAAEAASLCPAGPVLVVTGRGNNGGDGWVAARCLLEAGQAVSVLALAGPDALGPLAAAAARAAIRAGVPWRPVTTPDETVLALAGAALVVDAVFGIGLRDAPREPAAALLDSMDDADAPVVAVDVPSGVDADTGAVPGAAVRAGVTVTFGWAKAGLLLHPGAGRAGDVVVAEIGLLEPGDLTGALEVWDWSDLSLLLPLPSPTDHKYDRGRVIVVGGAPGLTGAAVLATEGALRMGAGHVTVAVPAPSLQVVECAVIAPVKAALPVDPDGGLGADALARLLELSASADAVVLGPGLGRAGSTRATVREFLRSSTVPVVLDADGLYAIGADLQDLRKRGAPVVLTPHAGEASRLLGISAEAVVADRPAAARAIAGGSLTCVLKGARTLVSDGERVVVTMTGGPALATLGTGDILAGIVGALLAQGLDPLAAGARGAHLHGAAGDAAALRLTPVCCTAPDVLTYLPEAVRTLLG
jgi:NAD(P)H-hydrate epimerase